MHPLLRVLGTVCDNCPFCNYARSHPETFVAKVYEWHGKWCPAWKAQKEIEEARAPEGARPDAGPPRP